MRELVLVCHTSAVDGKTVVSLFVTYAVVADVALLAFPYPCVSDVKYHSASSQCSNLVRTYSGCPCAIRNEKTRSHPFLNS